MSIEELTRVLQSKSNVHEVNMDISQINNKIEEMLKDLNKKMANCVLQQEHVYLSSQLEKKADLDFVQEALSQKANKQSVANALHRKANRSDMDELLQNKVEVTDFQNLGMQVQGKCE